MPSPKIQRWVDLLAALLRRTLPATLDELREDVPAYLPTRRPGSDAEAARQREASRRMFERDKDELRAFGIPIETKRDPAGEVVGYQLRRDQFYLPYLSLLRAGTRTAPRRPDRYGYQTLRTLSFDSAQFEAVVEAAQRVRRLGEPRLVALADSALRKLAFDLPGAASMRDGMPRVRFVDGPPPPPGLLAALDAALQKRKRVTIRYHAIGNDTVTDRTVEPFGLFFLGHHWYLAARDSADGPVKNFRVSRIRSATPNPRQPATPDFEVPASFDLREHARSRQAWELGDAPALEAIVAFRGESGPAMAARRLGEAVPGAPTERRFTVRRPDVFARWLLSFGGEVVPLAPPELVAAFRGAARDALARHGGPA